MILVLDTTAIFPDLWLRKPGSETFLRGLPLIPAKLLVPEVVVDEATNHYRRGLEKAVRDSSEARKSLSEFLGEDTPSVPAVEVDRRVADYREALLNRIAEAGGEVLPYPQVDHKTLVQRDLADRKPFREGKGYRDALIWESLRRQIGGGEERVLFISNNSKDFGKAPDFHDELRREVLNPKRLKLAHTIAEVNKELILPKTQMLEDVRRQLDAYSSAPVDLWAWLTQQLPGLLQDTSSDLLRLVSDFPEGEGPAWPREVVELKKMHVLSVRELDSDSLLVRLEARAEVSIALEWPQTGFLNSPRGQGWGRAGGLFDSVSSSVLAELRIGLDLMLDGNCESVLSAEVGLLATSDAWIHDGTWDEPSAPTEEVPEAGA